MSYLLLLLFTVGMLWPYARPVICGVAGSNPTCGCCVPMPTQRAIPLGSVNEYQRKLGSKWAYYVMHCPRIRGLAALAGVQLRAKETDQRCPMGLKARKKT